MTHCGWSHGNTEWPTFSIPLKQANHCPEERNELFNCLFYRSISSRWNLCLLLELCCSFPPPFGILLWCPKPTWHYVNIYKTLEVMDCTFASLRSLWNDIFKMQVLLWNTARAPGEPRQRAPLHYRSCSTSGTGLWDSSHKYSARKLGREHKDSLPAVSRGFVKSNT